MTHPDYTTETGTVGPVGWRVMYDIYHGEHPDDTPRAWDNLGHMSWNTAREYFPDGLDTDPETPAGSLALFGRRYTARGWQTFRGFAHAARWLEIYHGAETVLAYVHPEATSRAAAYEVYDADDANALLWVTRAEIVEAFGDDSDASRDAARENLLGQLADLSAYYRGEVFAFEVFEIDADGEEGNTLDACRGYYAEADAIAEAEGSARGYAARITRERAEAAATEAARRELLAGLMYAEGVAA